ncbi:hypothetical protein AV274_4411 [Blastocystis sp. ATCC 50177/Nand II]|uniref:Uncharacterized protein n=1 Tax=Blastocystis sp. subtype 1 (strain ATCC 50177 / NandII) TaxID=478820 RepID=A0A196SCR1_BLAHN|nr:hypothetical protein AV274_4411 [Blastocystis sp. ATCC 50177/Nand II]
MDSKAGKIIIAASGVVAAGAALWYIWKKFIDVDDEEEETQAAAAPAEKKEEEVANLPIPKKTMIKIFSEISESIEMVMMQLGKYEEQLRQNPSYTNDMVNQEIQSKFELMLTGVEDRIYEINNVKKEDVNTASEMLQNDRDFKRATYRLRTMFAVMQGNTPEPPDVMMMAHLDNQLPEFVTLAFTLDVMREVMGEAGNVLAEVIKAKKAELGITDPEEFKKKLENDEEVQKSVMEEYMEKLDGKRTAILEKHNIDKAILQIAMMVYQNDPSFQQAMIEISTNQQKVFNEIGFTM